VVHVAAAAADVIDEAIYLFLPLPRLASAARLERDAETGSARAGRKVN
jgi:hypothetical protein